MLINNGQRWTRAQVLLAMNLYSRIPFGRQHSRAPEVIELANAIGKTPSAVAMKLNNITSLDPDEAIRGVKGLPGASDLDRAVWKQFENDWESLASESETLWENLVGSRKGEMERAVGGNWNGADSGPDGSADLSREMNVSVFKGPTEMQKQIVARRGQNFFRRAVMTAYRGECCVTGLGIPGLLVASHILPWKAHPEHRVDPRNGLLLSRLHDGAFDQHLMGFDEERRLVLGRTIRDHFSHEVVRSCFAAYEGKVMRVPQKFLPCAEFLKDHCACLN